MAHYVQIPKDLNDIKQKFMFGLTKRQVVSFGIGGVLGIPLFFLTRSTLGVSGAIFAMGAVAASALICGLYKKNGIFFEQTIKISSLLATPDQLCQPILFSVSLFLSYITQFLERNATGFLL